jgi:hypothetical protein
MSELPTTHSPGTALIRQRSPPGCFVPSPWELQSDVNGSGCTREHGGRGGYCTCGRWSISGNPLVEKLRAVGTAPYGYPGCEEHRRVSGVWFDAHFRASSPRSTPALSHVPPRRCPNSGSGTRRASTANRYPCRRRTRQSSPKRRRRLRQMAKPSSVSHQTTSATA